MTRDFDWMTAKKDWWGFDRKFRTYNVKLENLSLATYLEKILDRLPAQSIFSPRDWLNSAIKHWAATYEMGESHSKS